MYRNHTNNNEDNIKFLELQAGPEYMFHLKFASVNTILFSVITLGTAFPVLYYVAIFALVL